MSYNRKTANAPIGAEFIKDGHLVRKVATGHLGWQSVHRIVMAEKLGRALRPWELVHHINGDKLDNRLENLRVVTRVEHTLIHNRDKPFFSKEKERTPVREKRVPSSRIASPIGTECIDAHGYLMRKVATGYKGWKKVHRLVMEEKLGKPLLPSEIVHHINHNKLDNRPENLEIMTRGEHIQHHSKGRLHNNGGYKKPPGKWAHQYDACIACGTTEIPHWAKGLCHECYYKQYIASRRQTPEYREWRHNYQRQRHKQTHLVSGRWATHYDACIECGTTERRHVGHGLCNACKSRLRYHAMKHTE